MTNTSSEKITSRNFSPVFEKMCNFIAVAKTGDPEATIRGLVTLCLLEFPHELVDTAKPIRNKIEILFGLAIPDAQLEEALSTLERNGSITRPAGTNYQLNQDVANELRQRIQDAEDLEKRVKDNWFVQLEHSYSLFPQDKAWNALRTYLSRTFRRHGIQAAALLDPTVSTSRQHDASLSSILDEAIRGNIPDELYGDAESALSDFLALVGTDSDRSRYVAQLADGAFNFYTLEVPCDLAHKLRSKLSDLTLFLDTNFLFGIMELHHSTQVEVSLALLQAISTHKIPFKLRYHEETNREMRNTINHYGAILRSRTWTRSLSRAGSQSRNLSGIEQRFHEQNAIQSIDVDEFLRLYEHFDQLLSEKDIKVYRSHDKREQAQVDLYHDYNDFLIRNGRGDKAYETVMHDAKLLEEARHLRSNAKSSLEAGALIITCDYFLYRFDWESSRRNRHRPCVLLPNILWQILRPFVPSDQNFDKAFAETFALPGFRALGSGGAKACSKMLQVLATYRDVPEETVFKLMSNDLLLNRLCTAQDDTTFAEQVQSASIAENKDLLEEKAALEGQLKEEKRKWEAEASARLKENQEHKREQEKRNKDLAEIRGELDTTRRAMEEHNQTASSAAQSANDALTKAQANSNDAERAEQTAFRMSVIAGGLLGILSVVLFLGIVHLLPWTWLVSHKNTVPLQIGVSLTLLCSALGLLVTPWRKWCWGGGIFTLVITLLTLMGN